VETASAREVHHFALLGGYGAEAVHPYLALETVIALNPGTASKAIKNYVKAIGKGLKKVMSKMGISTYMSYTGSQQFEAVGLAKSLVEKYFTGTASNIEGIDVFQVADEALRVHRAAFDERDPVLASMLDAGGEYAWRVRGEDHRRYAPVKAGESLQSRLGKGRIEVDFPLREGDSLKSKIKQVASGRFGVTAEYLASAEMLQIKIAQGAKPGEGGQLPGKK